MSLRSELISVQLPDNAGNTVPFYTYDGYLEEPERHRIRAERRSFEQLQVTGAVILGFASFIVTNSSFRLLADYPSQSSLLKVCQCPLPDYFPEWSEASSAGTFLVSTDQPDSPSSSATWC